MAYGRINLHSYNRHNIINALQSILLIGIMCLMLSMCAYLLFGESGFFFALVMTLTTLLLTPNASSGLIMRMYRATELDDYNFPQGCALVRELSARAGLEQIPKLYYVPSHTTNAFTVGSRDSAAIAVTDGLLRLLDTRELAGVLAHEISHIEHRDLWIMNLADIISRLVSLLSSVAMLLLMVNLPLMLVSDITVPWLLIAILLAAPMMVSLLQLALSRIREFDADLAAANLTGDPAGLASALNKLEYNQGRFWQELLLPGRRIPEPSALRTHPPTEQRISRLMALYDKPQQPFGFDNMGHERVSAKQLKKPKYHWHGLWF